MVMTTLITSLVSLSRALTRVMAPVTLFTLKKSPLMVNSRGDPSGSWPCRV